MSPADLSATCIRILDEDDEDLEQYLPLVMVPECEQAPFLIIKALHQLLRAESAAAHAKEQT